MPNVAFEGESLHEPRVVFERESLRETIRLLRMATGIDGPPLEHQTCLEGVREVLRLTEILESLPDGGEFVAVQHRFEPTGRAHIVETWVVFQPTELLQLRAAAVRLGWVHTPDGNLVLEEGRHQGRGDDRAKTG